MRYAKRAYNCGKNHKWCMMNKIKSKILFKLKMKFWWVFLIFIKQPVSITNLIMSCGWNRNDSITPSFPNTSTGLVVDEDISRKCDALSVYSQFRSGCTLKRLWAIGQFNKCNLISDYIYIYCVQMCIFTLLEYKCQ